LRIGEGERTAQDCIASSTAQRMAIHLPQQDWLPFSGGKLSCVPQAGKPGNAGPCLFPGPGLDGPKQSTQLMRANGASRRHSDAAREDYQDEGGQGLPHLRTILDCGDWLLRLVRVT